MNSMSNEEVIRFLLAFTNSELYSGITFEEVVSLDIEIDKTVALPPSNKIKWMEDKVKRLKLDGTKIEDLDLIQESENRQYLKSWGMVFNYKLDSQLGKAPFRINFFFQKSEPHEFSFNIEKISLNKTNSSKSKIENFILDEIDNIKLNIYNNLLK